MLPRRIVYICYDFMGKENLAAVCKVSIDKLGILQVKDRAARKGGNPQTGEEIKIPAGKK